MIAPELAVVVAQCGDGRQVAAALDAIAASCEGLRAEIIVVKHVGVEIDAVHGRKCVTCDVPEKLLMPERWARGFERTTAANVAFVTDEFRVRAKWARALLGALENGAVGAAGGIALVAGGGAVSAAVFMLRYSAFLGGTGSELREVADIPGDTAMYRRSAIMRHVDMLAEGFWEVEFHRRFRSEGQRLVQLPEVLSEYSGEPRLGAMLRQRFEHGREFGRTRVGSRGEPRWRVVLPAPAVPIIFALRSVGRLRAAGQNLSRYLRAIPALLLLASGWAAGEVVGAISAGSAGGGEGR